MRIATGTYTGNGAQQTLTLPFRPQGFLTVTGNHEVKWWSAEAWNCRTNSLASALSAPLCIAVDGTTVIIGSNADVNNTSSIYYWLAFEGENDGSLETSNYQGNGLSPRTVALQKQAVPQALIIKRDTPRPAVMKVAGSSYSCFSNGTASNAPSTSAFILALASGSFTVDAAPEVNENTGNKGEATQINAFFGAANCKLVTYTGDGAASQTVPGSVGAIKGALIWPQTGAVAMRYATDAMPSGRCYNVVGAASITTELTLSGSGLVVASNLNTSGTVYYALVFGPDDGATVSTASKVPSCAPSSGRKVIYLPGRDVMSYIDCGASDTLRLNAGAAVAGVPYAIEWMGRTAYYNTGGAVIDRDTVPLIARTADAADMSVAGGASWGVHLAHFDDDRGTSSNQGCAGAAYFPVVTDRQTIAQDVNAFTAGKIWRSGIIPKIGHRYEHMLLVHEGSGLWKLYIDGRLTKQRSIDMVSTYSLPNTYGGSGHRTMVGADLFKAKSLRMHFALARIYNQALTPDQVLARYRRAAFNDLSYGEVAPLEEWDAARASGTTLPATINPANSGTIVNGTILTL